MPTTSAQEGGPAVTPSRHPGPQIPPGAFPPGVDPATYRLEEVTRLLRRAAYLPIFSVPDPGRRNQVIPLLPGLPFAPVAFQVHEQLHRFSVRAWFGHCGLVVSQRVGEPAASVHIRWTVIPDGFEAGPKRRPPPTVLLPFLSQRFAMLDGELRFEDGAGSGFHGFGTGRTFPAREGGRARLRIGAVIDVLEGFGAFAGLPGTVVVNGYLEPPNGMALNLMLRFVDLEDRLVGEPEPLREVPDPDPDAVYMALLGEPDPAMRTELESGSDGSMSGARVHERLRLVHLDFDVGGGHPRARLEETDVAGTADGRLFFDPFSAPQGTPVPFQTRQGVFSLHDRHGCSLGSLHADVVEGRGFATELPGAPMPVFRFGGFGPLGGGSGLFAGVEGMMTLNAIISVFPRTLSNLYVFRLVDSAGGLRRALGESTAAGDGGGRPTR